MAEPILRVENLTQYRDDGFVLDIPHLAFQSGKIHGLVGPNGAGKSTLLYLLNLLEGPASGVIYFREQAINRSSSDALDVRRKMTMVMENPLLFQTTVFRNLVAGLRFRSINRKQWTSRVSEVLDTVGLPGFEMRYAHELSRGETQRVAIARALILKPELLLLDEPFSHIDKEHVRTIERLITTVNEQYGTTILFTTHDILQAYRLSDTVTSIVGGTIVDGSLENLFAGQLEASDGLQWIRISPSIRITVVTDLTGKVHLSIPPRDIILSHEPFQSTARNTFRATIQKVQLEDHTVRVTLNIAGEIELTALITITSLNELHLMVGSHVFLTFKSTSVTVF